MVKSKTIPRTGEGANFNQGMEYLKQEAPKAKAAKLPETSNPGVLDAWRKIVDASASEKRGGEPAPAPYHAPGVVSAHEAWMRAIAPTKS